MNGHNLMLEVTYKREEMMREAEHHRLIQIAQQEAGPARPSFFRRFNVRVNDPKPTPYNGQVKVACEG